MTRFLGFLSVALPALALMLLVAGPAQAQAERTWVSGVGDDANPCSRTAPCKTFAGAIPKTAVNGEINCLDPSGFGTVTIIKSITIDCHEVFASINNDGVNAILIAFDNFAGTDVRKTVRVRNILMNGNNDGIVGVRIIGAASADSTVVIEDCLIDGNFGGSVSGRGIDDVRSGGGRLIVTNTTVRNVGGGAISVQPASGSTNIQVLLNNVRSYHAGTGAQFGNGARVVIHDSAFTANIGAGVLAQIGAIVNVNRSVMTHNANGVQTNAGGLVVLSNSDIAFNTSNGILNGGTVQSFGNNRISNNAAAGAVPSLIGSTSNPTGQQ